MGAGPQGEHGIATSPAIQCLALFMEPMYRVMQLVTAIKIAVVKMSSYLFQVLAHVASWSRLSNIRPLTAIQPQAPVNAQRSSLYRVERFMWTNSRCDCTQCLVAAQRTVCWIAF